MENFEEQFGEENILMETEKPSGKLKVVKLSIVLVFLLLLISVLGFGMFSKDLINEVQSSDKKINSLIDEVGEVKEKNRVLTEIVEKENPYYAQLAKNLQSLELEMQGHGSAEKVLAYTENIKEAAAMEQSAKKEALTVLPGVVQDIGVLDFLIVGHHDGLTDTIILASINSKLKTVSFISVPRDLYIDGRKINEFYTFHGVEKLAEEVAKVTGIQAEKYMVVDMDTFIKVVDLIGGIDVTVKKDITDYYFPDDKGYNAPYSIKEGQYHMTGEESLKYARSRKTTSDFDRSKRQQEILAAIRKQIKEGNYLKKVKDLMGIYTVLISDLETNIDILEVVTYLRKYQDYRFEIGNVLSNDNFLYSKINDGGAYILLPQTGNYKDIQAFVKELVEN
jgi:LCP family protein required for cell wall assembly